ncbi:MAG: maleylpyruvate isomerase family mycothiol-dependent enzyme [Tetrasphaera sp.]
MDEHAHAEDVLGVLTRHTNALITTAAGLDDVAAPSRCEGWTRAHVLTHVARNADALGRLVSWAVTGVREEMYPGGPGARDAEIEAGAGRPHAELVGDVATSAAALALAFGGLDDAVVPGVEMRGGRVLAPGDLPVLRLREVVYHHVDLDAGFGFADVDDALIRTFLEEEVARLDAHPERPALTIVLPDESRYLIADGGPEVHGERAAMLLWLARRDPSGVTTRDGSGLPDLPRGA